MKVKFRMGYVGEKAYNDETLVLPEGVANVVNYCQQVVEDFNAKKETTQQLREFLGILEVNDKPFKGDGDLDSIAAKKNLEEDDNLTQAGRCVYQCVFSGVHYRPA